MERKFFKKLNSAEMLALDWADIPTKTWEWSEFVPGRSIALGGNPDRAIWFQGEFDDIFHYCKRYKNTILQGGALYKKFTMLAKSTPGGQVTVQLRGQMPQDYGTGAPGVRLKIYPRENVTFREISEWLYTIV